jgi:hypothetical protein
VILIGNSYIREVYDEAIIVLDKDGYHRPSNKTAYCCRQKEARYGKRAYIVMLPPDLVFDLR